VLAARERRRLAGFAIMEFYDEHAHLSLLAVQPGYQRLGIGRQLIEWLESSARVAGTFTVRLELRASNDGARLFYERLGYREVGRRPAYYGGREDALRMVPTLPQPELARSVAMTEPREFKPLNVAVLTVSDTRNEATDKSGAVLVDRLKGAGHRLAEKAIVRDDVYAIRAIVSKWIADPNVEVVITTGGTGITGRDGTPEAIAPLLDKEIQGFGELFRTISYEEIGPSSLQSRCLAGSSERDLSLLSPRLVERVHDGLDKLIATQLDYRTRPCNLAELMPRLKE
jgi:molybdenum cofactor biosynthesis protein B